MILVLADVVAASILCMIPEPHAGRLELCKRLAQTLCDIGIRNKFIETYRGTS